MEYEVETNKRRFGFEINNLKQTYLNIGALVRDSNDKYIPNEESNIFVLHNGKLFILQDELSVLYLIYNEQRFIVKESFDFIRMAIHQDRQSILEHIYNISSIEYKQRSPLFKSIRNEKCKI